MKLAAWAMFVSISACFCVSFYAQHLERRNVEVRASLSRPSFEFERHYRVLAEHEQAPWQSEVTVNADGESLPY